MTHSISQSLQRATTHREHDVGLLEHLLDAVQPALDVVQRLVRQLHELVLRHVRRRRRRVRREARGPQRAVTRRDRRAHGSAGRRERRQRLEARRRGAARRAAQRGESHTPQHLRSGGLGRDCEVSLLLDGLTGFRPMRGRRHHTHHVLKGIAFRRFSDRSGNGQEAAAGGSAAGVGDNEPRGSSGLGGR